MMELNSGNEGVRLRKNVAREDREDDKIEESSGDEVIDSGEEDDNHTPFLARIFESSKELADVKLPSLSADFDTAKKMLGDGFHAAAVAAQHGAQEIEKMVGEGLDAVAAQAGAVAAQAGAVAAQAGAMAAQAAEQAEEFMRKVITGAWNVCHFQALPHWLQDNDYLVWGHRPPLPSFSACFRSIFRIHTETGNIWTHMIGCLFFVLLALYSLISLEVQSEERWVFGAFFAGAIICLGFSFTFHTVHCHSECVGKFFSKLDYVGIALLIMGSFLPWLYYGFYCQFKPKLVYVIVMSVLGIASIVLSLWDKFSEPRFRALRAGVFITFGSSGAIPAIHYVIKEGWLNAVSFGTLLVTGGLYILGALLYAMRVPERFFPGKCDIWFQSHQIFHVLVIAAAFIHYQGISELAMHRLTNSECTTVA